MLKMLLGTAMAATQDFQSPYYLSQTASHKFNKLWTEVIADDTSNNWYSTINKLGIFVEKMEPTMHEPGDQMR